jgi:hypothetical protein
VGDEQHRKAKASAHFIEQIDHSGLHGDIE